MTGFGAAAGEHRGCQCRLEIKTLNNRFKEFVVRSPHHLVQLEEPVKKIVGAKIHRGRVELWIIVEPSTGASGLTLDLEAAREIHAHLKTLSEELGLDGPVTLEHLLRFNVLASGRPADPAAGDADALRDRVLELAAEALEQLLAMREAEGRILVEDLRERLNTLEENLAKLKVLAADAPQAATRRYQARLEELAGSLLDPDRLAQEAAISAEKMDITEEITRFGSHIRNFRALLDEMAEPIGRRLEFLLQEMVREANTMGSKSQAPAIGDLVLEFKSELEKIREQALNLE
jgi:uncharacterized protein (TIGR00255 family)